MEGEPGERGHSRAGAGISAAVPVVIIGAGAAGLVAALAAREAGAEVLVLERDALPRGSTALSAGLIPAAGTRWQNEADIADNAERFARDILTISGPVIPQVPRQSRSASIQQRAAVAYGYGGIARICGEAGCRRPLPDPRPGCPVRRVERSTAGVVVEDGLGFRDRFDHVVMATHADQVLAMLKDRSPEEHQRLSAFRHGRNRAVLHRDAKLMPRRRRLWSSWKLHGGEGHAGPVFLHHLRTVRPEPLWRCHSDMFVSLNPQREPEVALVER